MSTERNPTVRNMEIDAHSVEPAIVIRYEASSEDQRPSSISSTSASVSPANRVIQKIIHLKDLNELADSTAIAHVVLEMCPIIPPHKIVEVEQVIFYIQKRMSSAGARGEAQQNGSDALTASMGRASIRDIETYVEMLYEDAEKPKAVAYLLDLTHSTSNLGTLIENEVLMGALARVFREDSKKNFELATNIANIFFRFSQFAIYQATLSHCKVGALTMQLIEHELKRWDLWKEQAKDLNETAQRKWDFAMKKQDQLIAGTEQPNLTADGGARSDDEPNLTLCTLRVDGRAEGAARQLVLDHSIVPAPSHAFHLTSEYAISKILGERQGLKLMGRDHIHMYKQLDPAILNPRDSKRNVILQINFPEDFVCKDPAVNNYIFSAVPIPCEFIERKCTLQEYINNGYRFL